MEVKYRRVKVGFVFEFNSLISNHCAYYTVIIYTYFLSEMKNLELTAHRLLVLKQMSNVCPSLGTMRSLFCKTGLYINTTENIPVCFVQLLKFLTYLTNSTSNSKFLVWFLCVCSSLIMHIINR